MGRRGARASRAIPRPRYGACGASSKVGYVTLEAAKIAAQKLSRQLLQRGQLVESIYSYTCESCSLIHLTRMKHYRRRPANHQILPAPPLDAQLWAMPDHHRARVEAELARAESVPIRHLPDPRPEPVRQPYANRPRGLRR